jgi:hypothetical protein
VHNQAQYKHGNLEEVSKETKTTVFQFLTAENISPSEILQRTKAEYMN